MSDTYQYIVNRSRDFITLINRDYRYEIVNDSYCEAIGRTQEEILHHSVAEVWGDERFRDVIKPRLDECLAGSEVHFMDEFRFGATRKSLHVSFYPYHTEEPAEIDPRAPGFESRPPSHVLVFSHDVTYLAEVESRLARFEYRDPTTGLYNRRSLNEMLAAELDRARRAATPVAKAVLFVSLRAFKKINQTFGHHIGDLLLENTANRVRESIRSSDMLFRFDGTNLVVVLTAIAQPTDAAVVAQKIADEVGVPYQYKGRLITIETHIGITLYPDDAETVDDLIQRANSSSIEAEERALAFLFHDAVLHEQAVARMETISDLHAAIAREELELFFHPIIAIAGGTSRIAGAEALIRWNHPTRGLLSPDDFIDLAEGSRLIAAIDKWALFRAVTRLDEWLERYDLFLSINVSAHEFRDEFLPEIVRSALAQHPRVNPQRFKLELTERRSMENPTSSIRQMEELSRIGVDIWIDDFGTGHSSLSYLKQLPASALKIDKALVDGIEARENDRRYIAGIVESIRARGKSIIVEGVMSDEQARIIGQLGCDYVQGYFYGRPVPAAELERLLEEGIGALADPALRQADGLSER